jgi:hypothetical protein
MGPGSALRCGRGDRRGWGEVRTHARLQAGVNRLGCCRPEPQKQVEGSGTREAPRGLATLLPALPADQRETRLPRPRQTVSQQPRTATSFNRLTLFRRRRAGRDVLPGPPKRGVWFMLPRRGCRLRGLRVLPSFRLVDFSRAFTLACIEPRAVEQCTAALPCGIDGGSIARVGKCGTELSRSV